MPQAPVVYTTLPILDGVVASADKLLVTAPFRELSQAVGLRVLSTALFREFSPAVWVRGRVRVGD